MSSHIVDIPKQIIPDILIYEMDEGQPIYYRGYQQVLNKTKTAKLWEVREQAINKVPGDVALVCSYSRR